jgi:hypothetical protein
MTMRQLLVLVPGTSRSFAGGGLFAELKTMALAQQICEAQVVTYRQREDNCLFLDDLLKTDFSAFDLRNCIFMVGWGFDAPKLIKRLQQYAVIYHAHSAGYGFRVSPQVPIITVSRNTMGYWGQQANNSLIYYLPNEISPQFYNQQIDRPIDILVQVRKSSTYLLNQLIPALEPHCNIQKITGFIDNLPELFNQSKVYLYDSADYWAVAGVTEGFGLPPLEAMACGCQVFSSVNHGLSDFLDPGFNCQKIGGGYLEYDRDRILAAVANKTPYSIPDSELAPYREPALVDRLRRILTEINQFFDRQPSFQTPIPGLNPSRLRQLWLSSTWAKVRRKLGR